MQGPRRLRKANTLESLTKKKTLGSRGRRATEGSWCRVSGSGAPRGCAARARSSAVGPCEGPSGGGGRQSERLWAARCWGSGIPVVSTFTTALFILAGLCQWPRHPATDGPSSASAAPPRGQARWSLLPGPCVVLPTAVALHEVTSALAAARWAGVHTPLTVTSVHICNASIARVCLSESSPLYSQNHVYMEISGFSDLWYL